MNLDGQSKNWLQFFAEFKSAVAQDWVLLEATGAEVYPPDLQPNKVPQAHALRIYCTTCTQNNVILLLLLVFVF
jgi:hypothetical protein